MLSWKIAKLSPVSSCSDKINIGATNLAKAKGKFIITIIDIGLSTGNFSQAAVQ